MRKYLQDRGVQASAAAGVVIGVLAATATEYRPVWLALGLAWAAATVWAIVEAGRKHA